MSDKNEFSYDEDDAVRFIRNYLPQELKDKFSDDEINYIIDVVYDFYDEKGFMADDTSDEDIVELDEDELIDYAIRSGAPLEVIENLQEMEDEGEVYECMEDIWPDYPSKEDFFFNEEEY